jgi:Recombination endonuclease VII
MDEPTCSIEGCAGKIFARGWCNGHWYRWRRYGDPGQSGVGRGHRPPKPVQLCSVEGCGRPHDSRGYCNTHYTRWLRHGDPLIVKRERNRNGVQPCSEDGCEEISQTGGMCGKHYGRWLHSQRSPCSVEGCDTPWVAQGLCGKHYHRQRSWGTTDDQEPTPLRGSCSVEGCDKPVKSRGWCGMHVRRWYKWGTTELPERAKMRKCNRCGDSFPLESFTSTTRVCITCWPEWRQEQQAKRLSRRGGRHQEVAELRAQQEGRCKICKTPEAAAPGKRLHLDHDHATGAIRGLLCGNCNVGLGQFKDNPDLLAAAIRYLQATQPTGQLPLFAA